MRAASARASSSGMGPNPATSPGAVDPPSHVASGIVRLTEPVSTGPGGVALVDPDGSGAAGSGKPGSVVTGSGGTGPIPSPPARGVAPTPGSFPVPASAPSGMAAPSAPGMGSAGNWPSNRAV